jgi:hypothetical protein
VTGLAKEVGGIDGVRELDGLRLGTADGVAVCSIVWSIAYRSEGCGGIG